MAIHMSRRALFESRSPAAAVSLRQDPVRRRTRSGGTCERCCVPSLPVRGSEDIGAPHFGPFPACRSTRAKRHGADGVAA